MEFAVGDASPSEGIFAGGSCGWIERRGLNPGKKCSLQRCGIVVLRLDDESGALCRTPRNRTNAFNRPDVERKKYLIIFLVWGCRLLLRGLEKGGWRRGAASATNGG